MRVTHAHEGEQGAGRIEFFASHDDVVESWMVAGLVWIYILVLAVVLTRINRAMLIAGENEELKLNAAID